MNSPDPTPAPGASALDRRTLFSWLGGAAALAWLPGCGSSSTNCWPTVSFPPGLEWGPFVALPTPTSILVGWRSTESVIGSVRVWRGAAADLQPDGAHVVSASGERRVHRVTLTGLEPGTRYAYQLQHGDERVGSPHAFRTPPATPAPSVRIAVVGDTGSGCPAEFDIVKVMQGMQPDLLIHVGDLVYNTPDVPRLRARHFWPFAPLIDHVPLYPVWGNHDVKPAGWALMQASFPVPRNAEDATRHYYAFRRGPCHIVVLDISTDSLAAGSDQVRWLEHKLAEPAAWKIVCVHKPPYSSHPVPVAPALRTVLGPIFDRSGVDLVLSGDAHFYERTFPIRAGKAEAVRHDPVYTDPSGPVYVTTGGGGGRLYALGVQPLRAVGATVYHAVELVIDRETLGLTASGRDGRRFDRMQIRKTGSGK